MVGTEGRVIGPRRCVAGVSSHGEWHGVTLGRRLRGHRLVAAPRTSDTEAWTICQLLVAAKFAKENGITFALVSDKNKAIKEKYGRGRVTYLIDKHGVIRWIQKGVPDNQVFLAKLRELRQDP